MLDGMLDAFDRFIQQFPQHSISGHAQNALKSLKFSYSATTA